MTDEVISDGVQEHKSSECRWQPSRIYPGHEACLVNGAAHYRETAAAQGAAPHGRSSDPEPAPPPDDRDWTAEFHALDDAINERLRAGAVPALQATGEPPTATQGPCTTECCDMQNVRHIHEAAGATGEGEQG